MVARAAMIHVMDHVKETVTLVVLQAIAVIHVLQAAKLPAVVAALVTVQLVVMVLITINEEK